MKTKEQLAADAALDRACARVIRVYGLLPAEPDGTDYIRAYHEIATGIVTGALDVMKGALNANDQGTLDFSYEDECSLRGQVPKLQEDVPANIQPTEVL